MKIFKKISLAILIFAMLLSSFPALNANAVAYTNVSVYTPANRATMEYFDGALGLNYTSFNNFVKNPNISGAFQNDERQFLAGKNCGPSTTNCESKAYYNTLDLGIKEGDIVRFAVYFHNNGGDPYVKETSVKSLQDATNAKIGLILNRKDPNAQFAADWLRPQGYIYADNNQYRTTIANENSVIKNSDGSILRTATDDMAIMLKESNLSLEPIQGSAWLWNKNANFDQEVKVGSELTFVADSDETPIAPATKTNLAKTKVTAINYSPNEMSISFDRLPGCFRYSGFVYFDVKVVKKADASICSELKVTKKQVTEGILGETAYGVSAVPTFAPKNIIPEGTKILWKTTDKDGKFWKRIETAAKNKYKYTDITVSTNSLYNSAQANPDEEIFYTGVGIVTAELTGISANLTNSTVCTGKFEFKEPAKCADLKVNKNATVNEKEVSEFSAIAKDTLSETYNGKITYFVPAEYGTFYTDPNDPAVKNATKNTSQTVNEYDAAKVDLSKPRGGEFCGNTVISKEDLMKMITGNPKLIKKATDIVFEVTYGKIAAKSFEELIQESLATNPASIELIQDPTKTFEKTISEEKQIGSKITVNPGTKVYFVANKGSDGKKVISILANCTSEKACSDTYEIKNTPKEKPVVCEASGMTVIDTTTGQVASCIKNGTYTLTARFYKDANKTQALEIPANMTAKWQTTDAKGLFYDVSTGAPANQTGSNSFIGSTYVKYVGEGQVTATLVALNGKPYTEKACTVLIPPCSKNCESILFSLDGQIVPQNSSPFIFEKDTSKKLSLSTKDNQNNQLPATTKLNVVWNTNGTMTDSKGQKNTETGKLTTTLSNLPLTFLGADKAGQITITLDPTDPLYSAQCKADLSITKPEGPLTCKETIVDLKKTSGTTQETFLVANEIYVASAKTEYTKTATNKNTFYVDQSIGTIVETGNDPAKLSLLNVLKSSGKLTKNILENFYTLSSSKTLSNGFENSLYFVTYSVDRTTSFANAFRVKADGFSNAECDKVFPLVYTEIPEKTVCEDLTIETPERPWTADGSKELFEIDVTTTPKNKSNEFTYRWEVTDGEGIWSNGDDTEEEKGSLKNTLRNAEAGTTVEVYALDSAGKKIEKCSDNIKAKTNENEIPEIDKSVYVTAKNPTSTTKDLLNVGSSSKSKNITYKIQFVANSAETADIWESAMNNGEIKGDKDGNLSYLGMIINVTEGRNEYTILKDGNYTLENDDENFDNSDEDLDWFEDNYSCKDRNQNKVCIDDSDFSTTVENFKDGEKIEFQNLDTDTAIEIKVQMKNNTTINTESCKKLDASDGCGEQFKNTAKFEALMPDDDTEKGSASAKVIVICPYVLTRQAGDVFFHDVLDTGIDVSRCSEVKSTPGVVIQPEKIRRSVVTKTGTGELPTETATFLDVPSHDICRYSNTSGAQSIEGYNDILKNFSSTICEMRADVAETWKETYINESIKANVERISRFGENLNVSQVSTMQALQNIDNAKSGVFVKEGNLTIGAGAGTKFEIKSEGNIPAGQTYIVKGGTLHITSNIEYGPTDYTNPEKIPSAAFIVIDGNIVIDNNVTRIDAIIMAIDTDGKGSDGKITNGGQSETDERLVINGSLIGNVYDLFSTRTGAGDPARDEGSVTIRYDERILLNTPPGLSDLLNITQSLIPG